MASINGVNARRKGQYVDTYYIRRILVQKYVPHRFLSIARKMSKVGTHLHTHTHTHTHAHTPATCGLEELFSAVLERFLQPTCSGCLRSISEEVAGLYNGVTIIIETNNPRFNVR